MFSLTSCQICHFYLIKLPLGTLICWFINLKTILWILLLNELI